MAGPAGFVSWGGGALSCDDLDSGLRHVVESRGKLVLKTDEEFNRSTGLLIREK